MNFGFANVFSMGVFTNASAMLFKVCFYRKSESEKTINFAMGLTFRNVLLMEKHSPESAFWTKFFNNVLCEQN